MSTPLTHRLAELGKLSDGWFDGEGLAPLAGAMAWLDSAWAEHAGDLPAPFIYPMLTGGLALEWDSPADGITLEVELITRQGVLITDTEELINLSTADGWGILRAALTRT